MQYTQYNNGELNLINWCLFKQVIRHTDTGSVDHRYLKGRALARYKHSLPEEM